MTMRHLNTSLVPRREVILLGNAVFKKFLKSIQDEIDDKVFMIPYPKKCIAKINAAEKERKKAEDKLAETNEAVEALNTFTGMSQHAGRPRHACVGSCYLPPPLSLVLTRGSAPRTLLSLRLTPPRSMPPILRVISSTLAPRSGSTCSSE